MGAVALSASKGETPLVTSEDTAHPARLLDLTRSLRRAGRVATGIDRVERAYLTRFIEGQTPAFALIRTPLGYVLLDRVGLIQFRDRLEGQTAWGSVDLLSRLGRGRSPVLRRAESDLRRFALARARRGQLSKMLARHVPQGFDYYNVGHSNLTQPVLGGIRAAGGRVHVLVHDVIPLDHPGFQRAGTVQLFERKMNRVSRHADRVIYNSHDTQTRAVVHFSRMGRVPDGIVAHLGAVAPQPDPSTLPAGLPPARPYFVYVGTLEPRKNHAFLLDLWETLGPDAPLLLLCGNRGWRNESLFARLDALPAGHPVREVPGLSDPALAALVSGAAGSLFPSLVEGFGLPPLESLQLGTRVLCNDLGVIREFLGENVVYAPVSNRNLWLDTINDWSVTQAAVASSDGFDGPKWKDHFNAVLNSE